MGCRLMELQISRGLLRFQCMFPSSKDATLDVGEKKTKKNESRVRSRASSIGT